MKIVKTPQKSGEVFDARTGLVWSGGFEGQTFDPSTGEWSGSPHWVTWEQADRIQERYASFSDWRLPTIGELMTLYADEKSVWEGFYFPHWSSSTVNAEPFSAWVCMPGRSDLILRPTTYLTCVRLVRGGKRQPQQPQQPPAETEKKPQSVSAYSHALGDAHLSKMEAHVKLIASACVRLRESLHITWGDKLVRVEEIAKMHPNGEDEPTEWHRRGFLDKQDYLLCKADWEDRLYDEVVEEDRLDERKKRHC